MNKKHVDQVKANISINIRSSHNIIDTLSLEDKTWTIYLLLRHILSRLNM